MGFFFSRFVNDCLSKFPDSNKTLLPLNMPGYAPELSYFEAWYYHYLLKKSYYSCHILILISKQWNSESNNYGRPQIMAISYDIAFEWFYNKKESNFVIFKEES